MMTDTEYQGSGQTIYKYWRYQGFLCRYAQTELDMGDEESEGVLFVHGFGASCSQWNKLMHALRDTNAKAFQGLAPDLIGFGQAEKPAVSYTGYMWDSQVLDFVKEVAVHKHNWKSYIVGGNSIGGFTSLQLAACDTATIGGQQVTSTGGPGSNRCSGLILMNSAGPLNTRQEIDKMLQNTRDSENFSIAKTTIEKSLPPCKPPSRPIARAIGETLLAYLRPQVQSICKNVYPSNPSAVDDSLCDNIRRDSLDPGAINVMMAGAKLPPPRTANELLQADFGCSHGMDDRVQESTFAGPVLIAQGVLDPLNDATDRMNRFGSLRKGITLDPLKAGHCPHDELPIEMSKAVTNWMMSTRIERNAFIGRRSVSSMER
jgi:pimeloyl-ACP methyl ester carboxylesterase